MAGLQIVRQLCNLQMFWAMVVLFQLFIYKSTRYRSLHRHLLYRPERSRYPWRFRSVGLAQNLNGLFEQGTCSACSNVTRFGAKFERERESLC